MFTIILKAILGTATCAIVLFVLTFSIVTGLEYATESFGRWAPLVVMGGACAAMIFAMFVSFFRFEAKRKAEADEQG